MATRILTRPGTRPELAARYGVRRYGLRYWAVYEVAGDLVCVTLYRKGAAEVVRRLTQEAAMQQLNTDELEEANA